MFKGSKFYRQGDHGSGSGGLRQTSSFATQANEAAERRVENARNIGNEGAEAEAAAAKAKEAADKNTGDHVEFLASLWSPEKVTNGAADSGQQQIENKQTSAPEKKPTLRDHLDGLDFGSGIDYREFQEKAREGDFTGLEAGFKKAMEDTYVRAISDLMPEVNKKIDAAVNQAVLQAKSSVSSDRAVEHMESRLEFTKEPMVAPIARAVLEKTLQRGKEVDEAVDIVEAYFKKTAELGIGLRDEDAPRRPGDGGFGGGRQQADKPNFDELFSQN